jgi:copper(I)-binding protein
MKSLAAVAVSIAAGMIPAAASALEILDAWSPPGDKAVDLPLYMTIVNPGEADDILRFRCPTVAHFTEQRTTDYGEGAPSARAVKSTAIAASGKTELKPGGNYLALLKIIGPAKAGDRYSCDITFRRAGRTKIDVLVKEATAD